MEGKAWVQFRKVEEFVKRDQSRKQSQIKLIVQENQKRLSVVDGGNKYEAQNQSIKRDSSRKPS